MNAVKDKVDALIHAIRNSEEYQNFREAGYQVHQEPGLAEKIREFCWKNYELQTSGEEDMEEKVEKFEKEYEEFREHPLVSQYLERELRLCRMIQAINAEITNSVELMI